VLTSVLSAIALDFSAFGNDITRGALTTRLVENGPPHTIDAPVLLGQGGSDSLITPEMQAGYVSGLCEAGVSVEYRMYEGLGHVPLVEAESPLIPDLLEWTRDRHAGVDPVVTC